MQPSHAEGDLVAEVPPTPPPPSPEEVAQITKETAIRDMIAMISNGNLFAPASARILQALDNPLSHAPEAQIPLRFACAEVLRGIKRPQDCKVFGIACTPDHPLGSCMVSAEGACAAHYHYGRFRQAAV